MSTTLYAYVNAFPELAGRVFRMIAPKLPDTPYAVLETRQGPVRPCYGGVDIVTVFPCVTLYTKPLVGQNSGDAEQALLTLAGKIQSGYRQIDTHMDGATPFFIGSVARAGEFPPLADGEVPGQVYLTVRFLAQFLRG
jgi:hypothetical protein